MTNHFFENELVRLHYYKFGNGPQKMLCFHGFGMHGKQFKMLEEAFGSTYTFYGFDLFFHKDTKLNNETLQQIKAGISKDHLTQLFVDFCKAEAIERFSIIAYSMGSHYASTLIEKIPERIDQVIIAAPSCIKPGKVVNFFCTNLLGNKILEYLSLSENGLHKLLSFFHFIRVIDKKNLEILLREVVSQELRYSLYASGTYLRFLKLDTPLFIEQLNKFQIKTIFIFGERDKNYPEKIGNKVIPHIKYGKKAVLPEDHNMINPKLSPILVDLLA